MIDNRESSYSPDNKPRFFYGYIVVIAGFLIMVLMYGTRGTFGVFFKPMLTDFGWNRALLSGTYAISVVIQGLLGVITGGLTDRFGARVVMMVCGFLLGLGYLLMSQVNSVWHLYVTYAILVGVGMSASFVVPLSTVARWFVKRRGTMTGIVMAGLGVGTLIVPPLVTRLISSYGWRNTYIMMGVAILVIVLLAAQLLKRPDPAKGQAAYDDIGGEQKKAHSATTGFSFQEAIRTRQLWMAFAMYFALGFCSITINVHIVPHVTDLGFSPTNAAYVLAALGGMTAAGGIILGGVADRIGNRLTYILSFFLISAALSWLVGIKEYWAFFPFAIVLGLGNGGGGMLESPYAAELFGMRSHGSIFGVLSFAFTTGAAVGPFLAGYLFDVTGSYRPVFIIAALVGVLGIILSVALKPTALQKPPETPAFSLEKS